MVFDGGTLGKTAASRKGSTVVDLSRPGVFTVIREGRYVDVLNLNISLSYVCQSIIKSTVLTVYETISCFVLLMLLLVI